MAAAAVPGVSPATLLPPQRDAQQKVGLLAQAVEAAAQATQEGSARTAELRDAFRRAIIPRSLRNLDPSLGARAFIDAYLPRYNPDNDRVFGILVDWRTGAGYPIRSGFNRNWEDVGETSFYINILRNIQWPSVPDSVVKTAFQRLQHHVEAQAAALMRKFRITGASLFINATNPCYSRDDGPAIYTCQKYLPAMLPPGARLRVFGTESKGTYIGQAD